MWKWMTKGGKNDMWEWRKGGTGLGWAGLFHCPPPHQATVCRTQAGVHSRLCAAQCATWHSRLQGSKGEAGAQPTIMIRQAQRSSSKNSQQAQPASTASSTASKHNQQAQPASSAQRDANTTHPAVRQAAAHAPTCSTAPPCNASSGAGPLTAAHSRRS